ncbi:movement protein [Sporobolus striate mosaic virus 1]|uniref:Movement protein n=1 Tax=Sporobolus striate mosaic virus 1 TaxID=1302849 RepID=J7FHN0_9GEMI|nr:movement protein [Sporobolus striate mosaic virus 1]AFN80713.1 movement protein [Sporobolus striate mosaic virus 1]
MEAGHLPSQQGFPSPLAYSQPSPSGVGNDSAWRTLVLVFTITAVGLACSFALYRLCVKDLVLLLRAKRSRTVTELGFGGTPARQDGVRTGSGVPGLG